MIDDGLLREMIKAAKNNGGVTVDMKAQKIVNKIDEWLFPRYPDLTKIVPENRLETAVIEFIAANNAKLDDDVYLGIWRDDMDRYNIDINAHAYSLQDAFKLATIYSNDSNRSIISVYNPAKKSIEYL